MRISNQNRCDVYKALNTVITATCYLFLAIVGGPIDGPRFEAELSEELAAQHQVQERVFGIRSLGVYFHTAEGTLLPSLCLLVAFSAQIVAAFHCKQRDGQMVRSEQI